MVTMDFENNEITYQSKEKDESGQPVFSYTESANGTEEQPAPAEVTSDAQPSEQPKEEVKTES